ncbi:MAG TPA: MFS transporter [Bryobacteraceae bacterium]|jgi:predicted MFS family arabinose efflux permease|nr:MFS transporter [Bryobacteraceae bacterium]
MPSIQDVAVEDPALREMDAPHGEGLKPYARVAAVFACGAFAFLNMYCTQPLLPLLARVFRASEASVSLTISASTLGVAFSAALLAMFGERLNRKRTIVGSMIAMAIITVLTATAPNLPVLTVWRLLQGFLTPGVFIITIAYVTEEWPAHLVPRVMSWYVAGTVFGGFSGRVTGGMLSEHYGWRPMFVVLGVAGMGGAWLAHRLLQPSAPRAMSSTIGGASRFAPMLANLKNPRLLATFGIGFCMLFTLVSLFSYITFHLAAAPFHLSTAELSWLFTVYLFGLLTTLAVGTVLARIGLLHGILGAIGLGLVGTSLTLVPSLVAVGLGLSLASSCVFIAQTCANSFLRDAAPRGTRVSAAGLYICTYYIGGTVGGVLPGLFWKQAGWPGCVTLTCGFLMIAAALAFFGWRRAMVPDPIPL